MKQLIAKVLLGLTLAVGALAATPTVAKADHCYVRYHWECRTYWVKVAYTAYDHCGCPYVAYKVVAVRKWVKVYDY
jgi:hypothetical protein